MVHAKLKNDVEIHDEYGRPSTPRTAKLKATTWYKHTRSGEFAEEGIKICMDRARIATRVHKETELEPEVIRHGKATNRILTEATVVIREDEMIAGYNASAPNRIPWTPEASTFAIYELRDTPYVNEEDQEEVNEIVDYWSKHSSQALFEKSFPLSEEAKTMFRSGAFTEPGAWIWVYDSPSPNYQTILEEGLNGRIAKIEKRMEEVYKEFGDLEKGYVKGPDLPAYVEQYHNLKAFKLAAEGLKTWAIRHSRLCRHVAEDFDATPEWKENLLEMARICRKVPAEPAESLREALQAHWFIYLGIAAMERDCCGAAMKYDELMEPYMQRSIEKGEIDYDGAVELFEAHRLKFIEKGRWQMRFIREGLSGSNELFIITIGGVRPDGTDACSDCTDAILDAAYNIRTAEPSFVFRWHPEARVKTVKKVYNCVRTGLGYPSIKNDAVNINCLVEHGYTLEEARTWAVILCMSPHPTGELGQHVRCVQAIYPAKVLELILYDGEDPSFSGMRVQPKNLEFDPPMKKIEDVESVDEILEMFRRRMNRMARIQWTTHNYNRYLKAKYYQQPLLSVTFDSCIERGQDCVGFDLISDYWNGPQMGLDVADALAGLQKLVFDDKKYTMKQVIEACREDWDGFEEMKKDFLNAPKFGNDDDYVDEIAKRVFKIYAHFSDDIVPFTGGRIWSLPQSISYYATWGPRTGALPNGRSLGDPLSDGGVSPWMGCDKKGPTAVINSVGKIENQELKGLLLNMRLNASNFEGEKGFWNWYNFMQVWEKLGIDHIQYNCTDSKVLRDAQIEPDKHEDVIVRIAGYSARFIDCTRYMQDSIIARTECSLG